MASTAASTTSPAKRAAASGEEEIVSKRARTMVSDTARQCQDLASLFSHNPLVAKLLLTSMLERSLAVPADARHEVQQLLVATVGDTVATMASWKQAAVSDANGKTEELQAVIAVTEADISEHRLKAAELGVAFAEAAKELEAAKVASEEQSAAVKAMRVANRCDDKAHDGAATEFDRVVEAFDAFAALRDRDEQNVKTSSVNKIVALGKSYDFDTTMLQTLPKALQRAQRGPFDAMCLSSMEEKLTLKQVELNEAVDAHASAKEIRDASLEALQAVEAEAKATERACSTVFSEAEAAQLAAIEAELAASQRLRGQQAALAEAERCAREVATTLAAFVAGPVATFQSLETAESHAAIAEIPAGAKFFESETCTATPGMAGA